MHLTGLTCLAVRVFAIIEINVTFNEDKIGILLHKVSRSNEYFLQGLINKYSKQLCKISKLITICHQFNVILNRGHIIDIDISFNIFVNNYISKMNKFFV